MKLTKRKGFNFFRSYYDVYNELNDKDKAKIYYDIKELYDDRKHAEATFAKR